jgi:hypothetical protein
MLRTADPCIDSLETDAADIIGVGLEDFPALIRALDSAGFKGSAILEIGGRDNVALSRDGLQEWIGA